MDAHSRILMNTCCQAVDTPIGILIKAASLPLATYLRNFTVRDSEMQWLAVKADHLAHIA